MKISRKILLRLSGIGIIVVILSLIYFSTPGMGFRLNPGLQPSIDWAYLDEYRISFELKITGIDSLEPFLLTCPIGQITLLTPSGEVLGTEENIFTCWADEDQNYIIAQTFKHDLDVSSGKAQQFVLDLVFTPDQQVSLPFELEPSKGLSFFPAQDITNNDVVARLVSTEVNNHTIISEICFDFPSSSDWMFFPHIEGQIIDGSSVALLHDDTNVMESSNRCFKSTLYSSKGFGISTAKNITIIIDELVTSIPEMPSQELIDQANQRSKMRGVSFVLISDGHSWDLKILSKPDNMSAEDAQVIAMESIPDRFEGPWVFTLSLP
jgi:hypothetical protein